ncbi:unnamed protein product [Paramecium sonneborni]|uniref:Uncharacterized protein n=1 Tax=Paramecium sonneborni TaxID=65129 RepID=A0A8S1RCP3_9CILI|nr:unnamed protein product [Paramecium sonneborni]
MSQVRDMPANILNWLLEANIDKEKINQAWVKSGYDDKKIFDIIFSDENIDKQNNQKSNNQKQCIDNDNDFLEKSKLEKHVSKQMTDLLQAKKPRKPNSYVAIENNENDNILDIIFQLFHQIPQLYEQILKVQCNSQETGKFLKLIQLLLTELTASNQSFVSQKQILQSSFWGAKDIEFLEKSQDPSEIFFFLLIKIDFCLGQQMKQGQEKNENFMIKEFNSLFNFKFQGIQDYGSTFLLSTDMEQNSVLSFLNEKYQQKVISFPQFLCIQIKRKNGDQKIFNINQKLEIEFLKKDYNGKGMNQQNLQITYNDLEIIQQDFKNIEKVIEIFQEDENQQQSQDIIKIFKSKLNTLQRIYNVGQGNLQKEKNYQDNQSQVYVIYSIGLQKGSQGSKAISLYIQNYKDKNWLKFTNNQNQVIIDDEEVLIDSNKNAQFVIYINTNLIPQVKQHLTQQNEVCNLISKNNCYDINHNSYLKQLVPKDVLLEIFQNNLRYKQNPNG